MRFDAPQRKWNQYPTNHLKKKNAVEAGRRAKKNGAQFEELLKHSAEAKGFRTVRIPDGCLQVSAVKMIRVKSPFDFIFVRGAQIVFCDAKCVTGSTFPYSKINHDQLKHLRTLEAQGHKAGFVIRFNDGSETTTHWVGAYQLNALQSGNSLTPQSLIALGSLNEIDLGRIFDK